MKSTSMSGSVAAKHAFWIGLLIRVSVAWLLPLLLDDGRLIPGVAYTDIDYSVFVDAASYVRRGQTPYARDTYRYTPFLASLLAALPHYERTSRYLFCLADAACGWLILQFRRRRREHRGRGRKGGKEDGGEEESDTEIQDAMWWLYNPFVINICTRGSAESLVVLLPVLMTMWWLLRATITTGRVLDKRSKSSSNKNSNNNSTKIMAVTAVAGLWHGIAVHAKLYPIIYSLSYVCYLATVNSVDEDRRQSRRGGFVSNVRLWTRRLLAPVPIVFAASSAVTFVALTYLSVVIYGPLALEEGLLYHFSRVDHRHNYSMHWYWIYLARGASAAAAAAATSSLMMLNTKLVGLLLTVPQLLLLVYTSFLIAPRNLSLALFVQTFLFVAFNKVITAQYFTWYLCLLPLCSDCFAFTPRVRYALAFLLLSVVFWLGSAYCLEMRGMSVYRIVWVASVVFFAANINLLTSLLASYRQVTALERHSANNEKQD